MEWNLIQSSFVGFVFQALFDRVFRSNIGENMMGGERRENNEDFGELFIFAYNNKCVVVGEGVSKIYSKAKVRKGRLGH